MNVSAFPASTQVLIVGAGPTGQALAISLAQAGVDHVVIDRLTEGQNTSRAAVIHAHTLEALDALGVAEAMGKAGLRLSRFSIRDRDRVLVSLRFDELPSDFSYLLMLPQDVTERILTERLETLGGRIWRGVTADAVEPHQSGVRVSVSGAAGARAIEARYVVGADGMHSVVREAAQIAFEGGQYAHSFVLADVRMDWAAGRDEVILFFSPAGPVVVAPLPGDRFRIVAAMEDAPATPTAETIEAVLAASGPSDKPMRIREVLWGSRFRVHHRLARKYRRGRLLLMGDAAHVHSPAGGQGMNTGLVDATVLGRLLAAVVSGERMDGALDAYERLRRPAAAKVLQLAGGLTAMAMQSGAVERAIRNARLSVIDHVPAARRRMAMNLSGLSRRSASLSE